MSFPKPRPMISAVKRKFGSETVSGAEIGVYKGEHALSILSCLNIKRLFLVDFYKPYVDSPWHTITDFTASKPEAQVTLNRYSDRVTWLLIDSVEAAKQVENSSLDFVYIDANHSFEHVLADIKAWLPKVKSGGIIGGHDYTVTDEAELFSNANVGKHLPAHCPGVKKTVDQFSSWTGFELHVETSDWWVEKP